MKPVHLLYADDLAACGLHMEKPWRRSLCIDNVTCSACVIWYRQAQMARGEREDMASSPEEVLISIRNKRARLRVVADEARKLMEQYQTRNAEKEGLQKEIQELEQQLLHATRMEGV